MNRKKGICLPLILAAIWGCAQTTSPNWYAQNYAATFFVDKWTMTNVDGSSGSDKQVSVTLWNPSSHVPVSGGTVTLNSTVIPFSASSSASNGFDYQLDQAAGQSVPISLNGSPLVISVSGSSQFSALTDSIAFPNQDIIVTAPAVGRTISKSSDLTIKWDYIPGSSDSITISVFVAVDSIPFGNAVGSFTIADNGSFTVPASTFSSFNTGDGVTISVKRYDEKYGEDLLGRRYIMESSTESNVNHLLGQ